MRGKRGKIKTSGVLKKRSELSLQGIGEAGDFIQKVFIKSMVQKNAWLLHRKGCKGA